MVFYVTPSGLIFSQLSSSSSSSSDESDSKNTPSKKKQKTEAESPYLDAHVTYSNLSRDCLYLLKGFASSNDLNGKCGEIDVINLKGKIWVLDMGYNRRTGQAYIQRGWRNFCYENGLESGSCYRFKFVLNETRPSLLLCSDSNCSKPSSEGLESVSMKQNKFLKMTFKPYMLTSGQLSLPITFVRDNGIKEGEEITLVDKDGVKWPSYVACTNEKEERFYMTNFFAANKLMSGESFTLEFVRGETKTPMIKFCSKGKVNVKQASEDEEEATEETETWLQKREARARASCSRRSNKSSVDPKNLKPVQPFSDHVKKSILDTLIGIKRFRSELKIKEQNLEASLKDIDALGERVLEITKIFK